MSIAITQTIHVFTSNRTNRTHGYESRTFTIDVDNSQWLFLAKSRCYLPGLKSERVHGRGKSPYLASIPSWSVANQ